jgi:hypothetical protein
LIVGARGTRSVLLTGCDPIEKHPVPRKSLSFFQIKFFVFYFLFSSKPDPKKETEQKHEDKKELI